MLNKYLVDKKILFLSVSTFGLEVEISNKLNQLGAQVFYFDERPKNSILMKGLLRVNRSLVQKKITEYYKRIQSYIEDIDFDYLFILRGEVVPQWFIQQFVDNNPRCKKIFYTWDSFKNLNNPLEIIQYFDIKFSFDFNDALEFGLNFRPLFYNDYFNKVEQKSNQYKYDLSFYGTAHSDRYQVCRKVIQQCDNYNLMTYEFYYMQSKMVYLFKRFFVKGFNKFAFSKLKFIGLNKDQVLELFNNSKVILDINHPGQSGLTMRTIEAIGSGKKIITTNSEILNYIFYNPQNILVIDRSNPKIDLEFFLTDYVEVDRSIVDKLSISSWIYDIFNDVKFQWCTPHETH